MEIILIILAVIILICIIEKKDNTPVAPPPQKHKRPSQKLIDRLDYLSHHCGAFGAPGAGGFPSNWYDKIELKDDTHEFSKLYFQLMKSGDLSMEYVSSKANIEVQSLRNIKNGEYPSMETAICMILALNTKINMFDMLLEKLGYSLDKTDCFTPNTVIRTCVEEGECDLNIIKQLLDKYGFNYYCLKPKKYSEHDDDRRKTNYIEQHLDVFREQERKERAKEYDEDDDRIYY